MARADFITSLVLIVLGLGVVVESWRMPRFLEFGTSIWSAPGMVPGMIGLSLTLMGIALLVRSRGYAADQKPSAPSEGTVWRSVAIAFILCFGFAALLVGNIPFIPATFLFISAFTVYFDYLDNRPKTRNRRISAVLTAILVAGATSFLIATIFEDIFLVRLP